MPDYSGIKLDDFILSYADGDKVLAALRHYRHYLNDRKDKLFRINSNGNLDGEIAGLNKNSSLVMEIIEDLSTVMFEERRKVALKSKPVSTAENLSAKVLTD